MLTTQMRLLALSHSVDMAGLWLGDWSVTPISYDAIGPSAQFGGPMQYATVVGDRSQELQELLEAAALHERLRLAQDLHDRVAQTLAALVIEVEALRRRVHREPSLQEGDLAQISALAREALADLRTFVSELRSQGSLTCSIVERIKAALLETGARAGLETQFRVLGPRAKISAEVEENLLKVVQEALNNAERHSRARRLSITVAHRHDTLEIVVEDDGIGITDEARRKAAGSGRFGLLSMRERVLALGGTLRVDTGRGLGTKVTIIVPVRSTNGVGS